MYLHEDKGTIASLQKIIDLGVFAQKCHLFNIFVESSKNIK